MSTRSTVVLPLRTKTSHHKRLLAWFWCSSSVVGAKGTMVKQLSAISHKVRRCPNVFGKKCWQFFKNKLTSTSQRNYYDIRLIRANLSSSLAAASAAAATADKNASGRWRQRARVSNTTACSSLVRLLRNGAVLLSWSSVNWTKAHAVALSLLECVVGSSASLVAVISLSSADRPRTVRS